MKKITFLALCFMIVSCGVKTTRNYLTSGDYDNAVERAVEGLRGNKNAKGKQDYVYLLEEAFAKAKERDERAVKDLAIDKNPANLDKIYTTFVKLNQRQEAIKPLLPLNLIELNRDAIFPFTDYSAEIASSRLALCNYLYANSKALLGSKDKMSFRRAYDDLSYINQISPGYKDVTALQNDALQKGTDYVNVYTKNETNMVIPVRLQNDLLDFSTFGLNDKWTVYHSTKQKGTLYDYGLIVNFREINISPEQVKEREFVNEKEVKDGTKPLLNANGQPVIDNTGHAVVVDNMKKIRIQIYEYKQFKAVNVVAKVDYLDFKTNQLIETFPLASEFIFENVYAKFSGDRAACEPNYLSNFDRRGVSFPNNEQMVADAGQDLKNKLKAIISRNKFRRN